MTAGANPLSLSPIEPRNEAMRWLIGIGSILVAVGFIVAIWASAMNVMKVTEVPDARYTYSAITKVISVVNIDLVRVQILWFVSGVSLILLGAMLAATGYLGFRLALSPAASPAPQALPLSTAPAAPPTPPTPEQITEAKERDRAETRMLLVCGAVLLAVLLVAAVVITWIDQSANTLSGNKTIENNGSTNAATEPDIGPIGATATTSAITEGPAIDAKPDTSAAPISSDESGDVDGLETPLGAPTDDPSISGQDDRPARAPATNVMSEP